MECVVGVMKQGYVSMRVIERLSRLSKKAFGVAVTDDYRVMFKHFIEPGLT